MILDENYIKNKALSQSLLKKILISPQSFLKHLDDQENEEVDETEEPSENIMIGDACDLILTQGEEIFHEQFVITDISRPAPQVAEYAWQLFMTGNEEMAYEKTGAKISHTALKTKFEKEGKDYYNFLMQNRGKKILTSEQFLKVQGVVDSLRYNSFVSHFFNQGEAWQNFYQVSLDFTYRNEKCKGLMDLVHVDHEEQLIYLVDVKVTESSTDAWDYIFWKMGYYFQAAWYTEGFNLNPPKEIVEFISKGYQVIPNFYFVVESFKYTGCPTIYECPEEVLSLGKFGGNRGNKVYKGFEEALTRFKWHTETGIWNYPMDVYLNQGRKLIRL